MKMNYPHRPLLVHQWHCQGLSTALMHSSLDLHYTTHSSSAGTFCSLYDAFGWPAARSELGQSKSPERRWWWGGGGRGQSDFRLNSPFPLVDCECSSSTKSRPNDSSPQNCSFIGVDHLPLYLSTRFFHSLWECVVSPSLLGGFQIDKMEQLDALSLLFL